MSDEPFHLDFLRLLLTNATAEDMLRPQSTLPLSAIPSCFESVEQYVKVMEPLVVEEALAGIRQDLEESAAALRSSTVGKAGVSGIPGPRGVRIQLSGHAQDAGEGMLRIVGSACVPAGRARSQLPTPFPNDIVIISRSVDGFVANCATSSPAQPFAFGGVIACTADFDTADLVFVSRDLDRLTAEGLPASEGYWYVWSAGNIITSMREYSAMRRVTEYDSPIRAALLSCSPSGAASSLDGPTEKVVFASEAYKRYLVSSFNASQKAAISAALKSEG
jgi:hypothetical protein